MLSPQNTRFYFDYKDGKYGYNTSSERGADTFTPFSSGSGNYALCFYGIVGNSSSFFASYDKTHGAKVTNVRYTTSVTLGYFTWSVAAYSSGIYTTVNIKRGVYLAVDYGGAYTARFTTLDGYKAGTVIGGANPTGGCCAYIEY